jgi:hypothetical protein
MRVIPISPKATHILESKMGNNSEVTLQCRVGNKVLLSSKDGRFCSWVDLAKDPHWVVVLP